MTQIAVESSVSALPAGVLGNPPAVGIGAAEAFSVAIRLALGVLTAPATTGTAPGEQEGAQEGGQEGAQEAPADLLADLLAGLRPGLQAGAAALFPAPLGGSPSGDATETTDPEADATADPAVDAGAVLGLALALDGLLTVPVPPTPEAVALSGDAGTGNGVSADLVVPPADGPSADAPAAATQAADNRSGAQTTDTQTTDQPGGTQPVDVQPGDHQAEAAPAPAGPTGSQAVAGPAQVAPAPDLPTTPVSRAVAGQVVPEVTKLFSNGEGVHRVTLELNPRALGEVRVVLTVRDGDVHVRLAAGSEAREALALSARDLTRALELIGVKDHKLTLAELPGVASSSGTQSGSLADTPENRDQQAAFTGRFDTQQHHGSRHSRMGDDSHATDGTDHDHGSRSRGDRSIHEVSHVPSRGGVDLRM